MSFDTEISPRSNGFYDYLQQDEGRGRCCSLPHTALGILSAPLSYTSIIFPLFPYLSLSCPLKMWIMPVRGKSLVWAVTGLYIRSLLFCTRV